MVKNGVFNTRCEQRAEESGGESHMNICKKDILSQDLCQSICKNSKMGMCLEEPGQSKEADVWAELGREG